MNLGDIGFAIGTFCFLLSLVSWRGWTEPMARGIVAAQRVMANLLRSGWEKFRRLLAESGANLVSLFGPVAVGIFAFFTLTYIVGITLFLANIAPTIRDWTGLDAQSMNVVLYIVIAPALALLSILFFALPWYALPAIRGFFWLTWTILLAAVLIVLAIIHYPLSWLAGHPKGPVTVISFIGGVVGYGLEILTRFVLK